VTSAAAAVAGRVASAQRGRP